MHTRRHDPYFKIILKHRPEENHLNVGLRVGVGTVFGLEGANILKMLAFCLKAADILIGLVVLLLPDSLPNCKSSFAGIIVEIKLELLGTDIWI